MYPTNAHFLSYIYIFECSFRQTSNSYCFVDNNLKIKAKIISQGTACLVGGNVLLSSW